MITYCNRNEVRVIRPGKEEVKEDEISICWDITNYCNYSCRYCIRKTYITDDSSVIVLDDFIKAANKLRDKLTGKHVILSFTGGEPCCISNLKEIIETLFKDNGCTGVITIYSNLSNTEEYFEDLVSADTGDVKLRLTPSYHWVDIDTFISKDLIIKNNTDRVITNCVVDNTKSLDDVKEVVKKFEDNGLIIRLSLGRIPNTSNFYDLQEGVEEYCTNHNNTIAVENETVAASVEKMDGTIENYGNKNDVLIQYNHFKGFICASSLKIEKDFSLSAGICSQKRHTILCKDIRTDDFDLKYNTEICTGKNKCTLGALRWIWNGTGNSPS